jgi:hypothetical protein
MWLRHVLTHGAAFEEGGSGQRAMTQEACAGRRLGGLFRAACPSLDRLPTTTRGAVRARPQTSQRDARSRAGC